MQIVLTKPIRIDDVVIVEGEGEWVEKINTTYVVIRVWDLRRLVVPLSYFIKKSLSKMFQRSETDRRFSLSWAALLPMRFFDSLFRPPRNICLQYFQLKLLILWLSNLL